MEAQPEFVERRRYSRTIDTTTAVVVSREGLDRYRVSNLSVCGAMLTEGPRRPFRSLRSPVEVVLCLPRGPEIRLRARVIRMVIHSGGARDLCVEFIHRSDRTEDHIQTALLSGLEQTRAELGAEQLGRC